MICKTTQVGPNHVVQHAQQAPYFAGAQLAHFAEQGVVNTVFGPPGSLASYDGMMSACIGFDVRIISPRSLAQARGLTSAAFFSKTSCKCKLWLLYAS
eukprot:4417542-Amphidinium_carterae.1